MHLKTRKNCIAKWSNNCHDNRVVNRDSASSLLLENSLFRLWISGFTALGLHDNNREERVTSRWHEWQECFGNCRYVVFWEGELSWKWKNKTCKDKKKLQVLRTHQSFVSLWPSIFAYSLVEGPKRSLLPKPTIPPLLVTHSNDCNLSSEERSLQHFSWWAMVLPQVESQELVSQRYSLNVRELTVSSTYHLLSLFFCHAPI